MKRTVLNWLIFLMGMAPQTWANTGAESGNAEAAEAKTYYTLSAEPAARFEGMVPGRSYATIGNLFFAMGGRDAEGELSSEIQILEKKPDGWARHRAELPEPVAYAGAVGNGDVVYLAGGMGPDGPVSLVWKLEWDGEQLEFEALPPLPEPRLLPGVTTHRTTTKTYLYVLGGMASPDAETLMDGMLELPLTDYKPGQSSWREKEPMPMGGRLGGLVRQTYNEIVVSGGWRLEDGELVIDPQTWGYARVARDGHAEAGWEHRADQPVAVANPAYAKTGQSHLVIVGGDMSGGSPEAFFAGTKPVEPVPGIWAFHVPTDTWNQLGELPQGQAGGLLGQLDGETYLLTGSIDNQSRSVDPLHIAFSRTTKPMQPLDWAIIIMYFAVVAAIGAWFARKQSSMETFALGGRKVKWWAAAISMFATGVSTISYMALPALFACIGLVQLGGTVFILPGILVSAYLTYPLLRRLNITSTYEFLERRFGTALRLIGSFVGIMIQLLSRIGIVVMLPALAISSMTGMDPRTAILLTGIVTTIYSAAGGFEAVVWTDVTQGLLMMAGFIALGVLAFMNIDGGFGAFLEFGTELERFNLFIFKFDMTVHMIWFAFLGQIIMLMSFASEQTTAQRVLSTPMKDVRKLAWMFGVFAFLVALVVAFVGMGIFGFFKSQPEFLNPVMKNEQLVPIFILNKVPVGLAGLLIATMFAAAMSTISSSVNSSAVMFAEDFYKRLRKNVSNKEEMRVMQIATVFSGVVGTGLALWLLSQPLPTLWEGFTRIMALVGGGFVGVFALGMFTRRANELGAIIGVIASFLAAYYSQQISMDIHYAGLAVITKGVCIIVGYCVSLLIPSKPRDLTGLTIWDQVSDEEAEARIQAIEQASANSQQER